MIRTGRALTVLLLATVTIALMVGDLVLAGAGRAEASGEVAVAVAYADSEHGGSTNFPTPWVGSPGVTFEGCQAPTSCVYDAGAVRVTNDTGASITVNSVTVHLDTCVYTGWPSATIAPGDQLIVTQLGLGPGPSEGGCTGPTPATMDGSDIGPGGSGYDGNCTPDGIKPTVDVSVNGATTSYLDSTQVLNTGGFDLGLCPNPTSESNQWTTIGVLMPTTTVLLPSNDSSLSGTQWLDAGASNATSVKFLLFGGIYGYNAPVVCTATATFSGWLCSWNTTTVPDGSYVLLSEAFNSAGSTFSSGVGVTVNNPPPSTTVGLPAPGATISGSQWLDASSSAGVTKVVYKLTSGTLNQTIIATATPTLVGWLADFNSASVPNGTYTLQSAASYPGGVTGISPGIPITIAN